MHRMPYLCRSFPEKTPNYWWLFGGTTTATHKASCTSSPPCMYIPHLAAPERVRERDRHVCLYIPACSSRCRMISTMIRIYVYGCACRYTYTYIHAHVYMYRERGEENTREEGKEREWQISIYLHIPACSWTCRITSRMLRTYVCIHIYI